LKFVQQKTEQLDTLRKIDKRINSQQQAAEEEEEAMTNGVF